MNRLRTNDYAEVADYWKNRMPMMTMEELAELIQAISKYERIIFDSHPELTSEELAEAANYARENVIKEMADVYISCRALMTQYEIGFGEVASAVYEKLQKKY